MRDCEKRKGSAEQAKGIYLFTSEAHGEGYQHQGYHGGDDVVGGAHLGRLGRRLGGIVSQGGPEKGGDELPVNEERIPLEKVHPCELPHKSGHVFHRVADFDEGDLEPLRKGQAPVSFDHFQFFIAGRDLRCFQHRPKNRGQRKERTDEEGIVEPFGHGP